MKEDLLPFEEIKREILIKKEGITNPKFGCEPEKRPIKETINYGVINLNKHSGPTSHQAADYVKKILHIDKCGHSGTLDPKVTGVLVIALGKATRISEVLLKTGKEYVGIMHLHKEIPIEKIYDCIEKFTGKIKQLPPVRSAVKRSIRQREIYYFKILEIQGQDVLFKVGCQAGTYIRKLVSDLGKELGINAHMSQLVRTKVGPFTDKTWKNLHEIKDSYEFYKEGKKSDLEKIILPIEKCVEYLPKIWVFDNTVNPICHGSSLYLVGISKLNSDIKPQDTIAIMTLKNELIGLAKSTLNSKDILKGSKGIAAKPYKMFMDRNTYK